MPAAAATADTQAAVTAVAVAVGKVPTAAAMGGLAAVDLTVDKAATTGGTVLPKVKAARGATQVVAAARARVVRRATVVVAVDRAQVARKATAGTDSPGKAPCRREVAIAATMAVVPVRMKRPAC